MPSTLNVTFLSTNHIENVMGNARGTIGRVCRWRDETNQVARWMGVALLRAQSGFKRMRGHAQLGQLTAALARPRRPEAAASAAGKSATRIRTSDELALAHSRRGPAWPTFL